MLSLCAVSALKLPSVYAPWYRVEYANSRLAFRICHVIVVTTQISSLNAVLNDICALKTFARNYVALRLCCIRCDDESTTESSRKDF